MSRTFLKGSIAAIALTSVLGTAVLAQDAAPAAPADTAATVQAPTAETLPAPLAALNLTDVEIDATRRGGWKVEGDLPAGGEIDAFIDPTGTLRMVEADDDAALPQSVIDAMLPQAVRDNALLGEISVIGKLGVMDDMVMIAGRDADGEAVRAGFAQDGSLMRFGRGDDDHRGMRREGRGGEGRGGDDHARRGGDHGERHGDGHGKRGGDRDGARRGGGDGPSGQQRGDMGGDRPAPISPDAAQQALEAAGYTDIANITRRAAGVTAEAVNQAGEAVTVRVNPKGEVVRETAR